MDVEVFRRFRGISVMGQVSPQRGDKFCVIFPVVILQLEDVVMDAGLQLLVIAFGKQVFRKRLGAEKQQLLRGGDIGQMQGVFGLLVKIGVFRMSAKGWLKLTFR